MISTRWTILQVVPLLALLCALLGGCGSEAGNPRKPKTEPKPGQSVVIGDSSASASLLSAQMDEAISGVADDGADVSLGLNLLSSDDSRDGGTCTADADGKSVQVTIDRSGESVRTSQRRTSSLEFVTSGSETATRTWTKESGGLACNPTSTRARIDWAFTTGLGLDIEFERKLERTLRRKDTGAELRRSKVEAKGQRRMDWKPIESSIDSAIIVERTLTSRVERTLDVTTRSGTKAVVVSEIKIEGAKPMVIRDERIASQRTWQVRTIASGTVTSVQRINNTIDSRVEKTYTDVRFERAAGCRPVSGTIAGSLFAGEEEAAAESFEVKFTEETATIRFSNGETAEYVPDDCDLE